MKTFLSSAGACLLLFCLGPKLAGQAAQDESAAHIKEVAAFPEQQVTRVAVSEQGRVFVNFPLLVPDEHRPRG